MWSVHWSHKVNKKVTQIDNAKDIDLVISMYNLIEYSENCLQTSGNLWQYHRDQPALNDDGNITPVFHLHIKKYGRTGNDATKIVEISVPLKCLNKFLKNSWNVTNQLWN